MSLCRTLVAIAIFLFTALLGAEDNVAQPIPAEKLAAMTEGLISGEHLRYAFYGKRPVTWIENATGDEMLRRAKSGELPDDNSFTHTSFVYGSYWENCRKYYLAYRGTGDSRFAEQLRQYARLMSWILKERPWLILPKEQRHVRTENWFDTITHKAATSSIFQGYTLSARLTLQAARADRSLVTDEQIAEARTFLKTTNRYLDSLVRGDGKIDRASRLPVVAAEIVETTPYNQSFMYYAVLGVAAAGLEDLQHIEGHHRHQKTIDLYRQVVRAGVRKFMQQSDVTQIDGRPYVFRSYAPTDPLISVRDPKTRKRVPLFVDGHPIFRYPEGYGHAKSVAWYSVLLWETNERLGVTEPLLKGLANAHVDYQLRGQAPLKDGATGPPAKLLSPWTIKAQ